MLLRGLVVDMMKVPRMSSALWLDDIDMMSSVVLEFYKGKSDALGIKVGQK